MDTNSVGKRIKYERQRLNMTLKELGGLLKVSEQCISSWEHGRNIPNIIDLSNLANIFSIEIKDFLHMNTDKTNAKENAQTSTLSKKDLQIIAKLRALPLRKQQAIELLLDVKEN